MGGIACGPERGKEVFRLGLDGPSCLCPAESSDSFQPPGPHGRGAKVVGPRSLYERNVGSKFLLLDANSRESDSTA